MSAPGTIRRRTLGGLVAAAVVAALAASISLVAFAGASASAAAREPACTQTALQSAVAHSRGLKVIRPYGCDDGWAYAAVLIGTGRHQIEGTTVFRARGSKWVVVSRTQPCARGEIPRRIRRAACDSN